jgi:hypothetical protein
LAQWFAGNDKVGDLVLYKPVVLEACESEKVAEKVVEAEVL